MPDLIRPSALAAARRLLADPALFERAARGVSQEYDYGWHVEETSVAAALRSAATGTSRARDVDLVIGDARLFGEFTCRISPSGPIDWYEGDESDPSAYDLGPNDLYAEDLVEALRDACDLAEQLGWIAR